MAYRRQWSLLEANGVFADIPDWDAIPQFDPPGALTQGPHIGGLVGVGFCGGGGSSLGLKWAGLSIDFAMNHSAAAIAMHEANCPEAYHYCQNIWRVHPATVRPGEPIRFIWFSPDCTHFSRAKGAVPVEKYIRDLAWVIVLWMRIRRPDVVAMENVEEFVTWGPLMPDPRNPGQRIPDPDRKGEYFDAFKAEIAALGYVFEFRKLKAYRYGTPTIRERLFGIFRCDGQPIEWPEPTHERPDHPDVVAGRLKPWRTIAECIDWSIKCPSIFLTKEEARREGCKRPLVDPTMARLTLGLQRHVLEAELPYIVSVTHAGSPRVNPIVEPGRTQTCANRGEHALVVPHLTTFRSGQVGQNLRRPGPTMTANSWEKRPGGAAPHGIAEAFVTRFHGAGEGGEVRGQQPGKPALTDTAGGNRSGLVAVYMAQHNGGNVGHPVVEPVSTLLEAGCHQHVTAAHLVHLRGSGERFGNSMDEPAPTSTANKKGGHMAVCLVKYYGIGDNAYAATEPVHTLTPKDRFALVMVNLTDLDLTEEQRYTAYWVARMIDVWGYPEGLPPKGQRRRKGVGSLRHRTLREQIDRDLTPRPSAVGRDGRIVYDLGMRMLSVRERYRAQGVPDDFIIDVAVDGKPITATQQGEMCGNMVCPQVAEAIARAALPELREPEDERQAA
jgi:DNA (cytosine-5)-methyltransferase 1